MALTDPLGDMLTRIRNGQQAKKDSVLSPASKLRANVLEVLQREGDAESERDPFHPITRARMAASVRASEGRDRHGRSTRRPALQRTLKA